ncbi:hypothetical protein [Agrobacterium tumefaciens]|uniref:hypothetical protein n=1 Tax=Agrobacterium tumefaciens TaxID=358 RepID=UPI002FDA4025
MPKVVIATKKYRQLSPGPRRSANAPAEDVAGDLTHDQRASILAAVSASDYKKSPKAKNWVGSAVAYAVGLDLDDNVQRKRASSLVTALMREGALVEREERDPVRRELAVFVRAA